MIASTLPGLVNLGYILIGLGFLALAFFAGRILSFVLFFAINVFVLLVTDVRMYALLTGTVVGLAALPYGPRRRPRRRAAAHEAGGADVPDPRPPDRTSPA